MDLRCERCGIGCRDIDGVCNWCAAPARARFPVWIRFRRWMVRTRWAAEAARGGPVAAGVTVGVSLHLLAAAVGVAFRLPSLWQSGFLWSQQWWWALVPETWQPWLFAALVGIAYGALAGLVAGAQSPTVRVPAKRVDRASHAGLSRHIARPSPASSPATVAALVAFVVSDWDPENGTQYRLVAAGLAAAIGRLTTLIWRAQRETGAQRRLRLEREPLTPGE